MFWMWLLGMVLHGVGVVITAIGVKESNKPAIFFGAGLMSVGLGLLVPSP